MTGILGVLTGVGMSNSGGGGGGGNVSMVGFSITKTGVGTQTAIITVSNDGKVRNHNGTVLYTWLLSGAASDYEVRATGIAGLVSGTNNTWLNLGTSRSWSTTDSVADGNDIVGQLTLQVGNAGANTSLTSGTTTLTARSLS